ncbi:MAG: VOC family protein [Holophaga sp.]|jgi:hypothetical protein
MIATQLDHIAVTAPSLEAGCDYVEALLGVRPRPGGRHNRMGTHNCLLKLGPLVYLEVLAMDPEAGPPELPRWFRLDQDRDAPPRLAAWVARTTDVRTAAAASPAYGRIEPFERGSLRWDITLPERGGLVYDGVAPLLIQWRTEPHPAAGMPDDRCALVGLEGWHPEAAAVSKLLEAVGLKEGFRVHPGPRPRLVARIQTPGGLRSLGETDG